MNLGSTKTVHIWSAWEQVAQAVRQMITDRTWREGERLPAENDLAAQLGVSRGTLRRALRHLADQGLIESRSGANAGTYIRASGALAKASTAARIVQIRRIIEIPAATYAAQQVDPDRLAEIECQRSAAADSSARFEAHRVFHETLIDSVPDRVGAAMAAPMFNWLGSHLDREHTPAVWWDVVGRDHQRIIHAVRQRDHISAGRAMSDHLDHMSSCYDSLV